MTNQLPSTLADFSNAHVIVIGDLMLDRYFFGDTARISPEAPVPIVKVNSKNHSPAKFLTAMPLVIDV